MFVRVGSSRVPLGTALPTPRYCNNSRTGTTQTKLEVIAMRLGSHRKAIIIYSNTKQEIKKLLLN